MLERERAEIVRRTREKRGVLFCSNCGQKIPLPPAGEPVTLSRELRQQVDREQATAGVRTRFETALVQVKAMARDRPQGPSCFVSYAWDHGEAERWVEKSLAADLKNAGIDVILDRWDNAAIGSNVARFVSRIEASEWVLVVGAPLYRQKYENRVSSTGSVVAAEVDLINVRLLGTEEQKKTVLPVLLAGSAQESLPPLMRGLVYADFRPREAEAYFFSLLDLILTLYGIGFDQPAVSDLRESLRGEDGRRAEGLRG